MSNLTQGPWRACCGSDPDGCVCGLVWSLAADFAVVTVNGGPHDEQGELTKEQRAEITALVVAAPSLLARAERAESQRDRLRAALEATVSTLNDASRRLGYCSDRRCAAQFENTHNEGCSLALARAALKETA